jgi:rhodanese-related sulfurtransferase/DNA-binding HxlR family transcriptional regulator
MGDRHAKNLLLGEFAEVARALGNSNRIELIDVLVQGERHVDDLAGEIGQSLANTSFHLRTLATAGLVVTRREGTRVYYQLASTAVGALWRSLREVGLAHRERVAEFAAAYIGDRDSLEEISRVDLVERLEFGDVVVVDVRAESEYRSGHLPGAVSIPVHDLRRRLEELPHGVDVVAYCRGPLCAFADDAVSILVEAGRRALRLEGGFPEWRDAGFAVETG